MFSKIKLYIYRINQIYTILINIKDDINRIQKQLDFKDLNNSGSNFNLKGKSNMEFSQFYIDFEKGMYEVACEGDNINKAYYIINSQSKTINEAQMLAENLAKKNPGKKFFITGPIKVIETDIPTKSSDFNANS